MLPPGLARLSTKPAPTGSVTVVNTMGMERELCWSAATLGVPAASTTSGVSATISFAYLRIVSGSFAAYRYSIRTLRPMVQPNSASPCAKAPTSSVVSASAAARAISTPMRRTRSPCCACAASGHGTPEPAMTLMNSRRLIATPKDQTAAVYLSKLNSWKASGPIKLNKCFGSRHVRKGSIATEMGRPSAVRFSPDSDRTAEIPDCQLCAKSGKGAPCSD